MNHYLHLNKIHPISETEFAAIQARLKPRTCAKLGHLLVPGEVQKELYFVKKGIQMAHFESDTKSHVIAFTYFPDLCAIPDSFSLQKPSDFFLTCLSDSELDALSFQDLNALFDLYPNIERLFRKLTELFLSGMIQRHLQRHAMSMEERFVAFSKRSPHLLNLVPHKYLASYLDIDPTNFSKLFNSVKI